MSVLYFASLFIMVRSIFRVAEYVQGDNGYLLQHEYWLYIFDAALMAMVMIAYNVVHPNEVKRLYYDGGVEAALPGESLKLQSLRSGEDAREHDTQMRNGQS